MCEQFTAYYEGVPIASNICVYGSQSYVYLHGASSNEHRNVMAPYLLQWVQIQHAKQLGLATYDFWGISPSTPARPQTSFHQIRQRWNGERGNEFSCFRPCAAQTNLNHEKLYPLSKMADRKSTRLNSSHT